MDGTEDGKIASDLQSSLSDLLSNLISQSGNSSELAKLIFIALAVVFVLVIVVVAYMIIQAVINYRMRKMQSEHFNATLEMMNRFQSMSNGQKTEGAGSAAVSEITGLTSEELNELARECEKLGVQIDEHTDRRNNSKTVSELVYKLSLALGLEPTLAMLYFCVAMVYDAGFLDLPDDLFRMEILSVPEKKQIRTHVMRGVEYYSFVPEACRELFTLSSMLHHENMNGTGYPEGLGGDAIPELARIIHVVESYVSLISHRRYHQIRDKESAIKELRRQPGIYDMDIVDTLEKVM